MDRDKIREFVRQAHPKRKILDDEVAEPYTTASSDDRDVHVRNLQLSNWKKFGDAPGGSAQQSEASGSTDYAYTHPREKFRPRNLTGGTTSRSRTPAPARRSGGGCVSPQAPDQPSAKAALVNRSSRVHRIPPRVRDVRNAPQLGETRGETPLICPTQQQEYFCSKGWTGFR